MSKKKWIIAAIVAVVAYFMFRKRQVLDPSNSQALSTQFDKDNPEVTS